MVWFYLRFTTLDLGQRGMLVVSTSASPSQSSGFETQLPIGLCMVLLLPPTFQKHAWRFPHKGPCSTHACYSIWWRNVSRVRGSLLPAPARGQCNRCGTCDCTATASRFHPRCNLLCTQDIPTLKLEDMAHNIATIYKWQLYSIIHEVVPRGPFCWASWFKLFLELVVCNF